MSFSLKIFISGHAILLCLLFFIPKANGQCTYDVVTPIPDNSSVSINLIVSGLANNSLSSPAQGICGIEIEFNHEYLGDLTVTLISPSGTSVELIGPPTTTIGATNLSTWNIDFLPCSSAAAPDAGFTAAWSNLQAWQALSAYTGSYHPQNGCLEDFNNGPANGIWQIFIQDHDEFQVGSIAEITLLFCDPTGLACLPCTPNAGILTPGLIEICSGENVQSSAINIDFGGDTPSPLVYAYEYLLVSGNTILQNGTNFSITPPIGNYSICGLNYLISDSTTIDALIAADDYDLLSQAINQGSVCAELTTSCITLNVSGKPDTVLVTGDLCGGEVFSYGGQNYTTDGIFYQTKDGPGLCDTTIEIRIHPRTLMVAIDPPDTLFCGAGDVTLQSTPSGGPGPFSYQWSTVNGNITSSTTGASISVNQSGQYFVIVSDGICEGTGSANVVAGAGFPQVVFTGGTITCRNPVVNIKSIYSPASANLLWSGPMGFTSTQPTIGVSVPGTYTLNVTNAAGCTTTRSVDIGIDTTTVPIEIFIENKNCVTEALTLGDTQPWLLSGWQWNGPNMFSSNYWMPIVSEPGLYTLTASFPNGCMRQGTFLFDEDFTIPDIAVSPDDTLNCNEVITLNISSSTQGAQFLWNGPAGLNSPLQSVQIDQEGLYIATVISPNGCRVTDTVVIESGDDIFDHQIVTDTITCSKPMVTIGVIAPDADQFEWLNYTGPDDDQPMIKVSAGGNYTVRMTNSISGCQVIASVFVFQNLKTPSFSYTLDTITCFNPSAHLEFVPQPGETYQSVFWVLPDLSTVQGPSLISNLPGIHKLIGVGTNGCQSTAQMSIRFDTLNPFLILTTDTLLCRDTVAIVAQSLDSVSAFQWTGPGLVDFVGLSANVNKPGWYNIVVSGPNGCSTAYDILVDSNYALPSYSLLADSLRCDRSAVLSVIPSGSSYTYNWFDPLGNVISTDSLVTVDQSGEYTLQLEGINQCIAYDTVLLNPLVFPMVELSSDTFTCTETSITISSVVDITDYSIAWLDVNGDTINESLSINVTTPGPYITSVTGLNACTTRDTILPAYDTIPPIALIQLVGEIRCQNRQAILDGSSSNPEPLSYLWTNIGGAILSDPTLSTVDILDTGMYYLHVIQLETGCMGVDSLLVSEHPDAITSVELEIGSPECHGQGNATLSVIDVNGGIGVLNFQLDNNLPQSVPVFNGLSAGQYLLSIIDEANCVFDTIVQIDTTIVFMVDAGPDIEIYLGEMAELDGTTDLPLDFYAIDEWNNVEGLICVDCAQTQVSPLETTTYTYQVTSTTGCVLADEVVVFVIERAKYFIANIFSPNGDGINDEVRIESPGGIESVLQWIIFDRWGNAAFGKTNFDPMDNSVFWDGRASTGDFLNPGVFPYVVEFQLINGKKKVYHGEITLVR